MGTRIKSLRTLLVSLQVALLAFAGVALPGVQLVHADTTIQISGVVTDTTNTPLQGIFVRAQLVNTNPDTANTYTASDGTYSMYVPSAQAGYNIYANLGFTNAYTGDARTVPGESSQVVNFELKEAHRLSGNLYLPDGTTPLANVKIAASTPQDTGGTLGGFDGTYDSTFAGDLYDYRIYPWGGNFSIPQTTLYILGQIDSRYQDVARDFTIPQIKTLTVNFTDVATAPGHANNTLNYRLTADAAHPLTVGSNSYTADFKWPCVSTVQGSCGGAMLVTNSAGTGSMLVYEGMRIAPGDLCDAGGTVCNVTAITVNADTVVNLPQVIVPTTINVTSPTYGTVVSRTVNFVGSSTGDEFDHYKYEVWAPNTETVVKTATFTTPVTNDTLASLDTTTLPDGLGYRVFFTAYDVHGNASATQLVKLQIANAPIVQISSILNNSTVSGTVAINSMIYDPNPMRYYIGIYKNGQTVAAYAVNNPTSGDFIYNWNTTGLTNGQYQIVVSAVNKSNQKSALSTQSVKVNVAN